MTRTQTQTQTHTGADPRARTLRIDRIACTGRGLCAEVLPELIDLDEWGYPILKDTTVPPHLRGHARSAVGACPVLALRTDRARR